MLSQYIKLNLCFIQKILYRYSSKCLNTWNLVLNKNLVTCQAEIRSYVQGT